MSKSTNSIPDAASVPLPEDDTETTAEPVIPATATTKRLVQDPTSTSNPAIKNN